MANRELNVAVAAETNLSTSLASGATTMTVDSSTPFPAVDFPAVIDPNVDAKREVVIVTNVSGTTWTVTRGQDGTSDKAHDANAIVALVPVPALWTDIHDRVEAHTHSGGTDGAAIATGDLTGHDKAAHDALSLDHGSLSGLADFTTDHGTEHDAHDHSGLTGIPVVVSARKTADESVSNSTTLQDDDHLSLSLEASSTYALDAFLDIDASATGAATLLKGAFTTPSGATLRWGRVDITGSAASSGSINLGDTESRGIGVICGYITTSSTSGTLQFQWAQSSSDANNLTLKAGSWLEARKIA